MIQIVTNPQFWMDILATTKQRETKGRDQSKKSVRKDNIKMYLKGTHREGKYFIHLARDSPCEHSNED
jgi:hypothetical protein